jgi:hypothetical protein
MKTFKNFLLDCELAEGKIPWDDKNRPLRSGWTPREKNRAKRVSTGVENPEHSPSEKQLERYGKLKSAHDDQKNVKTRKDQRHKNPEDYSIGRRNVVLKPDFRMPSENIKGDNKYGMIRMPRNVSKDETYDDMLHKRKYGAKNDEKRDEYYKKGPKGLKEPKENFEYSIEEGKVEWDNPKRPLQSGLTPREKNRAKRISTNVENPDRVSFGGKSWDVNDKDYERYGKLKTAHDDEKGKKVPANKRQQFKQVKDADGVEIGTKGQQTRRFKDHKNIKTKLNSKLYKNDERQKVYHHNDLKEPK